MWGCCCTEEGDIEAEVIKKDNVWNMAMNEDSSGPRIVEASNGKHQDHFPTAPKSAVLTHGKLLQDEDVFKAVLERAGGSGPLGLYLDLSDSMTLYICRVNPGVSLPAHIYNSGVTPDRQLRDGDYILEVNGAFGKARDLADNIKSGGKRLELLIRRPKLFTHVLSKDGQSLGLDLQFAKQGWVLSICKILDGAVKNSGVDIQPGDRIVKVNGKEGKSDELLAALTSSDAPEVTISRCREVTEAYAQGFVPEGTSPDAGLS
mmetsp:Transcript_38259/g.81058  ORF Transcript_38259/g.81058 Transcript_38259/m.81058 type:complete len:261 (-) Transcript_38259:23-805(-)